MGIKMFMMMTHVLVTGDYIIINLLEDDISLFGPLTN